MVCPSAQIARRKSTLRQVEVPARSTQVGEKFRSASPVHQSLWVFGTQSCVVTIPCLVVPPKRSDVVKTWGNRAPKTFGRREGQLLVNWSGAPIDTPFCLQANVVQRERCHKIECQGTSSCEDLVFE